MKRRRDPGPERWPSIKSDSCVRFWKQLRLRVDKKEHAPCNDAWHLHLTRWRTPTFRIVDHCFGCASPDRSRTLRYDLRDDKAQDVPNKTGQNKIVHDKKFKVLTVQGLCPGCITAIFQELALRNDPAEYLPLLPSAMPRDLQHIVRDYVQPQATTGASCCHYCEIIGPRTTV